MSAAPRIAPLEPPYEPEMAALLVKWMPPGADVEPLKLFRTFGVHAELMSRMMPLGAGILGSTTVPPRLREVMIHRTSAVTDAEYEWGVHAIGFGRPLGFTDEHLASTATGSPDDECWDDAESAVFRLADQLHETNTITDELFADLAQHFNDEQILELIITAGWYHTIAYVINACGVQREEWAERFPSAR